MTDQRQFAIVGAGIGGLTAALALARQGFDVTVLEKSGELQEVGAGIQLSPNASRILLDLGVGPALLPHVCAPETGRLFSVVSGGEVTTIPFGQWAAARFGGPFWTVHRGDLQAALLETVRREPRITLELDAELRGAEPYPGGLTLKVTKGGQDRSLQTSGLIGADGVHSAVRTRLMDGPVARYSGRLAYRATMPIDETPADLRNVAGLWLAPKAHLVHYPIRAGRELNIVAIFEGAWTDDSWSTPAPKSEVLAQFPPVGATPWPELARALVAAPDRWTKWALRGVDPRFAWTGGTVTLIGDAAHAMLPFAAQGACMAIEDAAVLALRLAETTDTAAAMRAYEAARKPRATAVSSLAAANGRAYHMGPAFGRLRDLALKMAGGRRILERQAWVYDWRAS